MFLCQGLSLQPTYAEVRNGEIGLDEQEIFGLLYERLKNWNPSIEKDQFQVLSLSPAIWNNGSLGYPLQGKFYTQALVPGYSITVQIGEDTLEVHTDQSLRAIALPEIGLI